MPRRRDPQMEWNPVRAFFTIVIVMTLLMLWISMSVNR
jgi:hypothetical protein